MKRLFVHRSLSVAAALALLLTASASFADRDAGSKIRGEFGTGFSGRTRSYASRSYRTYAAPAPVVAAPAPGAAAPEVAPSPAARHAFSSAPETQGAAPQAAAAAPTRSYSYSYAPQRRANRRSNAHVRSYERADAKFLGHVGY